MGEGTFGKVLKIEYNNGYAALKIFKKELYSITLTEKDRKKIQNEIDMLTKANHENIVRVLEHGTTKKGNYIVMEFVDGGSLQRIVDSVPYTMVQAINWLQQAAKVENIYIYNISKSMKYIYIIHIILHIIYYTYYIMLLYNSN